MTHDPLTATSCSQIALPPSFRALGRLYKLAPGAMALDRLVEPAVDTARMCASAVISTPTPDRGADVLLPEGMQVENYRKNPVVLWEHGLSGIDFPIAKSEDPEGRLALSVSPAGVTATAYFTPSSPESEQIFALIAERIIRGASVRALMQKTHPRRGPHGEIGLVVDEWDLEEWSWVAVPANPEAVALVLDRGRLCGRSLAEPLRKSLAAMLPLAPSQGIGWTPEDEFPAEDESERDTVLEEEPSPGTPESALPFDDTDLDDDDDTDDDLDLDRDDFDDADFDDDGDFEDATNLARSTAPHQPLGARVLARLEERLARLAQDLEAALEPVEQPEVREHLASLAAELEAKRNECRERFASCYPRLAPLEIPRSHDEDLPLARRLARFLAAPGKRAWWRGLSFRLVRMAAHSKLPPRDAGWLRGAAVKLASLVNLAESPGDDAHELPASLVDRLDALEDRAMSLASLFPASNSRRAA